MAITYCKALIFWYNTSYILLVLSQKFYSNQGLISKKRPLRLAVRTLPFHGENTGSIPVGVTTYKIF